MPVWILPGKWHLLYSRKSNKAHHKTAAKYLAISHVREPCIRQQQQHIPMSVIQHSLRISCFLLSLVCLELYAFIPSMSIGFLNLCPAFSVQCYCSDASLTPGCQTIRHCVTSNTITAYKFSIFYKKYPHFADK